jgi:hypothetical protein
MAINDTPNELQQAAISQVTRMKDCLQRALDGFEGCAKMSSQLRYAIKQIELCNDIGEACYWILKELEPFTLELEQERYRNALADQRPKS